MFVFEAGRTIYIRNHCSNGVNFLYVWLLFISCILDAHKWRPLAESGLVTVYNSSIPGEKLLIPVHLTIVEFLAACHLLLSVRRQLSEQAIPEGEQLDDVPGPPPAPQLLTIGQEGRETDKHVLSTVSLETRVFLAGLLKQLEGRLQKQGKQSSRHDHDVRRLFMVMRSACPRLFTSLVPNQMHGHLA